MEIVKTLETIPLFKGLSLHQLEELAAILTVQEFKRGQVIFAEKDDGVGFYVVIDGRVKIYKVSAEGKEQILHILGAGEPFAEVAVFAGGRYPANAEAMAQSTVFFFSRDAFVELIKNNPFLGMNMMASLSLRLKRFSRMIEALSLKEVPGRLAAHLLLMSRQKGGAATMELDMAKTQLASLLGTIPETLSRILSKMKKQNLIHTSGTIIRIMDRAGLENLAAGETRLE